MINRRKMIQGIFGTICAGAVPMFVPSLVKPEAYLILDKGHRIALSGLTMTMNKPIGKVIDYPEPFRPGTQEMTVEVQLTEEGQKLFDELREPNTSVSVEFEGVRIDPKYKLLSFI